MSAGEIEGKVFLGRLTKTQIQALAELFNYPELFDDPEAKFLVQTKNGPLVSIDREDVEQLKWESEQELEYRWDQWSDSYASVDTEESVNGILKKSGGLRRAYSIASTSSTLSEGAAGSETETIYTFEQKIEQLASLSSQVTVLAGSILEKESDIIFCWAGDVSDFTLQSYSCDSDKFREIDVGLKQNVQLWPQPTPYAKFGIICPPPIDWGLELSVSGVTQWVKKLQLPKRFREIDLRFHEVIGNCLKIAEKMNVGSVAISLPMSLDKVYLTALSAATLRYVSERKHLFGFGMNIFIMLDEASETLPPSFLPKIWEIKKDTI